MYNNNNTDLVTIFAAILFFIAIALIMGFLITKVIIWIILGLFNYDLSDKFWYIFVLITIVIPMLRGSKK